MGISYRWRRDLDQEQLYSLYTDAGWQAYTKDMGRLVAALGSSLAVVSAWQGDQLVGLVRAVGDGLTILYIQDILVLKKHKRQGIGSTLIKMLLSEYNEVRQKVLLTDDSSETRGFYEALGFSSCDKGETVAFVKFN